ncbi:hypothetical protein BH10PSE11_BH10PSE11_27590 [soil metagenome]
MGHPYGTPAGPGKFLLFRRPRARPAIDHGIWPFGVGPGVLISARLVNRRVVCNEDGAAGHFTKIADGVACTSGEVRCHPQALGKSEQADEVEKNAEEQERKQKAANNHENDHLFTGILRCFGRLRYHACMIDRHAISGKSCRWRIFGYIPEKPTMGFPCWVIGCLLAASGIAVFPTRSTMPAAAFLPS